MGLFDNFKHLFITYRLLSGIGRADLGCSSRTNARICESVCNSMEEGFRTETGERL